MDILSPFLWRLGSVAIYLATVNRSGLPIIIGVRAADLTGASDLPYHPHICLVLARDTDMDLFLLPRITGARTRVTCILPELLYHKPTL